MSNPTIARTSTIQARLRQLDAEIDSIDKQLETADSNSSVLLNVKRNLLMTEKAQFEGQAV